MTETMDELREALRVARAEAEALRADKARLDAFPRPYFGSVTYYEHDKGASLTWDEDSPIAETIHHKIEVNGRRGTNFLRAVLDEARHYYAGEPRPDVATAATEPAA